MALHKPKIKTTCKDVHRLFLIRRKVIIYLPYVSRGEVTASPLVAAAPGATHGTVTITMAVDGRGRVVAGTLAAAQMHTHALMLHHSGYYMSRLLNYTVIVIFSKHQILKHQIIFVHGY